MFGTLPYLAALVLFLGMSLLLFWWAARDWLAVREFRVASSLTRLSADATGAVEALAQGKASPQDALNAVRSDVLDGYQARLLGALADLQTARARGFRTLEAEQAALETRQQVAVADGEGGGVAIEIGVDHITVLQTQGEVQRNAGGGADG